MNKQLNGCVIEDVRLVTIKHEFYDEINRKYKHKDYLGIVQQLIDFYDSFCDNKKYCMPNTIWLLNLYFLNQDGLIQDIKGYNFISESLNAEEIFKDTFNKEYKYKGNKYKFGVRRGYNGLIDPYIYRVTDELIEDL